MPEKLVPSTDHTSQFMLYKYLLEREETEFVLRNLGHKEQRGKEDPMKESKEQLNGEEEEAAEMHCQKRDIS